MYRYRVYTEDVNYNDTLALAAKHFQGFTAIKAVGYWNGKLEGSLVFEILTKQKLESEVDLFAYRLKTENQQEAVLVTRDVIEGELK